MSTGNQDGVPGLDEDVAEIIRLAATSNRPALHKQDVVQARVAYREARKEMSSGGPEMAAVRDLVTSGTEHPISLRCYRPKGTGITAPALIFYHGGGWVLGDLDTHDTACRILADAAGIVLVAVDYRLAPEHKFPAAVEDALDAARWICGEGAVELGIDPARVAVGGDSAGAVLATVTAIQVRGLVNPKFRLQLLIYPAADLRRTSRSQDTFKNGFLLTEAMQEWLTTQYLREPAQVEDWRASPLFAKDLTGLPPAWVLTAGFDPLRDEGLAYVVRLIEAGGSVTLRHYPGQVHGFITMGNVVRQAQEALSEAACALRMALCN